VLTASFDANASQTTAVLIPDDQNRAYNAITLTPLKVGVATLTVNLGEGNDLIKATCVVNAVVNPKNDRETPLVDKASNKQLYVLENNVYREAKYADYYNDALKFYIQTDEIYTGWQTLNGSVYYFDASGKKVTGSQVIQGAQYQFASDGALVVGSGTTGIDVSKWNGKIDWNAVKNSGVSYVIIRCGYRGSSQGALVEDPRFKENMKGAIAAGLKVGVYFFTQAIDVNEAVVEASMVLDLIKPYRISYPVFLDVEASGGRADSLSNEQRTEICKAFCETIKAGGYTPGIYANKTWFSTKMDANALSSYKIWLAQYASAPTYTGRYDMWQYKSTGKVSGITGEVDLNISYLGY
jgi:GH25 family lysozyme M1 (1,4-beta-N-acetylmuramidase)